MNSETSDLNHNIIGTVQKILSRVSSIDDKIPSPSDPENPRHRNQVYIAIVTVFGLIGGLSLIATMYFYYNEGLGYNIGFENDASTFTHDGSFALIALFEFFFPHFFVSSVCVSHKFCV